MTSGERSYFIKRALMRTLGEIGAFSVRESTLRDQAAIKVDFLDPSTAELDAALRGIGADRLAVGLPAEPERKWQITDSGRLWLAQNS